MKVYQFILTLFLSTWVQVAVGDSKILIDIDFGSNLKTVKSAQKGYFKGVLPKGVYPDYPGWNTSEVIAGKKCEKARYFLRFNVKKLDKLVLFKLSNVKIKAPGYYKLEVISRSDRHPLNLHIRQYQKPYKSFWTSDTNIAKSWHKQNFYIRLKKHQDKSKRTIDASNLVLYMSLKPGVTDISSVKLYPSDKTTYTDKVLSRIKRPEKGIKNLFRNSRFPLGQPTGWTIVRNNMTCVIGSDASEPGPSGSPSLNIKGDIREPAVVYSELFQTDDPDHKVQISFDYKAKHHWGVKIAGTKVKKTLNPTKQWKTVTLSYQPKATSIGSLLVFFGRGQINIDSLMAYSGNDARPYASAGDCEIALGLPKTETSATRIQFEDEPTRIEYHATGNLKLAILKAKVVNVYGEERLLPGIRMTASPTGVLDYGIFKEAPLGAFRIEVWAERAGKRISPCNEFVVTRIRRPRYWGKDAPNSPFGGHFLTNGRILQTIKAAGFNWVRLYDTCMEATCWGWIEPKPGKWKFADNKVKAYRKHNFKILGVIASAPTWASYFAGHKSRHYFDLMYQPKNIDAFKNYVRTVAKHYKGSIDEYQFQNEPWGAYFWHKSYNPKTKKFDPGPTPAEDYAKLQKTAYTELKQALPEANLYGFNTLGGKTGSKWTKEVFDAGGYPFCDMIDYHRYNNFFNNCLFPEDFVEKAYNEAVGYIKSHIKGMIKPVVMSEGNPLNSGTLPLGYSSIRGFTGMYKHTLTWDSKEDNLKYADLTCRFVISHLALRVKRIFLYSDHCYHNLLRTPSFPVVLGSDGYPSPTLAAFSNMAWLLEDRKFIKRIPVGNLVWAYMFSGKQGSVAVISGRSNGSYEFIPNKSINVYDLFGNRVTDKAIYKGQIMYLVSELAPKQVESQLRTKK